MENYRIRKVVLLFHLEDNSMSVSEIRQQNSGIPQGTLLKRQRVHKSDGSGKYFLAYDIRVGEDLVIFGKTIRVTDCDQYTREFFENIGQAQTDPEPTAADQFEKSVLPQFKLREWNGLNSSVLNGKVPSQKQFLENDRKVLKFYVFSECPYLMHYYLADDTLEIREINYPNSGKDPYPLLLRRQKLPRKFALNQPGKTVAEDFIKDYEIQYGSSIEIFGRVFKINGCDQFTKDYYKDKYNIDFPLGTFEQTQHSLKIKHEIPPYNGFGNEEDSLGNVNKLIPKPIRKDYFKWVDNQKFIRFTAKLNTAKPEDTIRRFIITLYLNDDTILIYEPQQRNSGTLLPNSLPQPINSHCCFSELLQRFHAPDRSLLVFFFVD